MSSNEYQIESFAYEWNWKQNKLKANWDFYFCLKWDWTWKREKSRRSPISQLILLESKDTEDFFLCPQSVTKWRANGDFFLFLKAWMILFVKTNHQWNLCYILIVSLKPDSDVLDVIVSHMDVCKNKFTYHLSDKTHGFGWRYIHSGALCSNANLPFLVNLAPNGSQKDNFA